jgi:hypothetical protein
MVSGDIKMEVVVSRVSDNKAIAWDALTNDKCRRPIIACQVIILNSLKEKIKLSSYPNKIKAIVTLQKR